jgi:hypothetical protein
LECDGTRAETRFRLSAKRTSQFKPAGGVSSVDCWQASCAHQPAGFVLLVQACVLQSRDAYWLPTPFSCFPFTSLPARHRVPSHFNWTLPRHPFLTSWSASQFRPIPHPGYRKNPECSLHRRLDGTHRQSRLFGEFAKPVTSTRIRTHDPPTSSQKFNNKRATTPTADDEV